MARERLTKARHTTLVELARNGVSNRVAAKAAGIGESTYYEWLEKGKPGGPPAYRAFRKAIELAKAELVSEVTQALVTSARKGNVRAQTYLLERLDPDAWLTVRERAKRGNRDDEAAGEAPAEKPKGDVSDLRDELAAKRAAKRD